MSKQPTTSELEILNILWEKESATVREVFEIISATKPITYTTVLKLMQIMIIYLLQLLRTDQFAINF